MMNVWYVFILGLLFISTSIAADNTTCDGVKGFDKDWIDFSAWDNILKTYVKKGELSGISLNTVNYTGVSNDPDFEKFKCQLKNSNTKGFSYNQWYAFYINAYNYLAVDTIISHACLPDVFGNCTSLKSIQDVGYPYPSIIVNAQVWDLKSGHIAGETVSLNDIEHERLRNPKAGGFTTEEANLHACIVCASISCPDLRASAYTVENLISEMEDNTRNFLNNTKKGLSLENGKLTISPIFNWFFDDFNSGNIHGLNSTSKSLSSFLAKYTLNAAAKKYIQANSKSIDANQTPNFVYDWNLNGKIGSLCDTERVCISPLVIGISSGVLGLILLVVVIVCVCNCSRRDRYGYVQHS